MPATAPDTTAGRARGAAAALHDRHRRDCPKETAARYAIEMFAPRWHGLIEDAMAYWRSEPPPPPYRKHPHRRYRDAVDFVTCVIDAANRLTPTPSD